MALSEQEQYRRCLADAAENVYLPQVEKLLGPRDGDFQFVGIGDPNGDRPCIDWPEGNYRESGCRVVIRPSTEPWKGRFPDQGCWQVAHEVVHLLNPILFGEASVMDEGLATWFQTQPKHHATRLIREYADRSVGVLRGDYRQAYELVRKPSRRDVVEIARRVGFREIAAIHARIRALCLGIKRLRADGVWLSPRFFLCFLFTGSIVVAAAIGGVPTLG